MTNKTNNKTGTLYGLGVGPGDPELLTLKALRILRTVPVLVYPAPVEGESMARAIAAEHLPGGQAEIAIRMPLDAARFPAEEIYAAAAGEIAEHLRSGHDVAVLCEGDPFFYGSFMYLFARLADEHEVEIVPGVSSPMACAAAPVPLPPHPITATLISPSTDVRVFVFAGRRPKTMLAAASRDACPRNPLRLYRGFL